MRVSMFDDAGTQAHARAWAVGTYGEASADLFVAWLCSQDDDLQGRACVEGYGAVRCAFEEDFERCGACTGWNPTGTTCPCFDNGCE